MPVKIFVIYAHEDKPVRDKLLRQLRPLADNGAISLWSDHEIKPGSVWDEEIRQRLAESEIILLLISDDFFASDYIRRVEFKTAINLQANGQTHILPIITRHCGWADMPALSRLQVLPPEGRPVSSKEWDSPDEPYLKIYEGVRTIAREIHTRKSKATPSIEVIKSTTFTPNLWGWLVLLILLILIVLGILIWFPNHKKTANKSTTENLQFDSITISNQQEDTKQPINLPIIDSAGSIDKHLLKDEKQYIAPKIQRHLNKKTDSIPLLPDFAFLSLFDEKLETVEGMTRIRKGSQQSFLDDNGRWIGVWFDDAENFHNGTAFVKKKNQYFWIDKKGKCVDGCN